MNCLYEDSQIGYYATNYQLICQTPKYRDERQYSEIKVHLSIENHEDNDVFTCATESKNCDLTFSSRMTPVLTMVSPQHFKFSQILHLRIKAGNRKDENGVMSFSPFYKALTSIRVRFL